MAHEFKGDEQGLRAVADKIKKEHLKPPPFEVGDTVKRQDGRSVKITGGAFLVDGRLSNFWYWREVMPNGALGEEERGYWHEDTQPEDVHKAHKGMVQ